MQFSDWPSRNAQGRVSHLSAVERLYPHLCQEIARLWGGDEIDPYLQGLIVETRHDRQGFPWEVINDLIFLSSLSWGMKHEWAEPEPVSRDADDFTFATPPMCELEAGRPLSEAWVLQV